MLRKNSKAKQALLQALSHIIKSEPFEGRNRLLVDNKDAADEISQLVIDNGGNGSVYGKFVNSTTSPITGEWWEVDIQVN